MCVCGTALACAGAVDSKLERVRTFPAAAHMLTMTRREKCFFGLEARVTASRGLGHAAAFCGARKAHTFGRKRSRFTEFARVNGGKNDPWMGEVGLFKEGDSTRSSFDIYPVTKADYGYLFLCFHGYSCFFFLSLFWVVRLDTL